MERRSDRSRWRSRRVLGALAACALVLAAVVVAVSTAAGHGGLTRIGATPRLPHGAVDLGPAASDTTVTGGVLLRPRDVKALERFDAEVTDPSSPQFERYLKKGQFAERFGPATSTVAAVEDQLQQQGLHTAGVSSNGLLVRFSGSAAHVSSAFATGLHSYRLKNGRRVRATTSAPALPDSIAGSVAAVVGLDEVVHPRPELVRPRGAKKKHTKVAKPGKFVHPEGSPTPCAAAKKDARQFGGLTDDQIAYTYGAFGLYAQGDTGAGVHVGVFEQEPFVPSDIEHFDGCYFGAAAATAMVGRLTTIPVEGGASVGPGEGEASLDVEDVSAMAPGASIDVYEAPESVSGELAEITAMIDEDRDQIITSSWGEPCEQEAANGEPGVQQAESYLLQQAAAQGQTFMNASGDTGSDACEEVHREAVAQQGQNPVSTTELASQPYVLGVGGTTITDAATQPAQEHVWNDGPEGGGGGGGISQSWAMPSWQRNSKVPGIALPGSADYTNAEKLVESFGFEGGFCDSTLSVEEANAPCRLVPDVSAEADEFTGAPTFYSIDFKEEGVKSGWITIGGTSSASPIWAGMLALAYASPTCRANQQTAGGVGFVSPLLYAIASEPAAYAASFNDITEGNNDSYGLDGGKSFPARAGYDEASGLGSPRLTGPGGTPGLAFYLCTYAAKASRPAVASLSPTSGSSFGGEKLTVHGSGFSGGVAGVQVGAWHAPANTIHVLSDTELTLVLPNSGETLPAGAPEPQTGAGAVQVIVTLTDGESSASGPNSTFQYIDEGALSNVPSVTGMSPSGGSETAPAAVTILGSGFTGAKGVTFGGVQAASFKVLSDSQILATPPAMSGGSACAPLPSTGVYAGENAANDVCQVEVVVQGASGVSKTAPILAPFEGTPTSEQDGTPIAPPGCGCEIFPRPTEFDYTPAPSVTSVSTSEGPSHLASETSESVVTVHGSGLNHFTFDYAYFGETGAESAIDYEIVFQSGTEIQIAAPQLAESAQSATVGPTSLPFSVRNMAGFSGQIPVAYAGVPKVASVANTASKVRLEGMSGAPDTGGTPIQIKGKGLEGQVTFVRFDDSQNPFSEGTNFSFTNVGDTLLNTTTVAQNPALADVQACTVSGCSTPVKGDVMFLYPPGRPEVQAVKPHSGPAAGGTAVVVHGQNLGCPLAVTFGANQAESFNAVEALLACGSTMAVDAVTPPGVAGTKVPVTVTTVESFFTGESDAPGSPLFSYTGP